MFKGDGAIGKVGNMVGGPLAENGIVGYVPPDPFPKPGRGRGGAPARVEKATSEKRRESHLKARDFHLEQMMAAGMPSGVPMSRHAGHATPTRGGNMYSQTEPAPSGMVMSSSGQTGAIDMGGGIGIPPGDVPYSFGDELSGILMEAAPSGADIGQSLPIDWERDIFLDASTWDDPAMPWNNGTLTTNPETLSDSIDRTMSWSNNTPTINPNMLHSNNTTGSMTTETNTNLGPSMYHNPSSSFSGFNPNPKANGMVNTPPDQPNSNGDFFMYGTQSPLQPFPAFSPNSKATIMRNTPPGQAKSIGGLSMQRTQSLPQPHTDILESMQAPERKRSTSAMAQPTSYDATIGQQRQEHWQAPNLNWQPLVYHMPAHQPSQQPFQNTPYPYSVPMPQYQTNASHISQNANHYQHMQSAGPTLQSNFTSQSQNTQSLPRPHGNNLEQEVFNAQFVSPEPGAYEGMMQSSTSLPNRERQNQNRHHAPEAAQYQPREQVFVAQTLPSNQHQAVNPNRHNHNTNPHSYRETPRRNESSGRKIPPSPRGLILDELERFGLRWDSHKPIEDQFPHREMTSLPSIVVTAPTPPSTEEMIHRSPRIGSIEDQIAHSMRIEGYKLLYGQKTYPEVTANEVLPSMDSVRYRRQKLQR
jgi:hypothetical protein